jgi:hypothetical protein
MISWVWLSQSGFYLWYKEFPLLNQNVCIYLFTIFIFLVACLVAVDFLESLFFKLAILKKGSLTIANYYNKWHPFQTLWIQLTNHSMILNGVYILASLPSEFDFMVTSITILIDPMSFEEFYGHLLTHESRIDTHIVDIHWCTCSKSCCHKFIQLQPGVSLINQDKLRQ